MKDESNVDRIIRETERRLQFFRSSRGKWSARARDCLQSGRVQHAAQHAVVAAKMAAVEDELSSFVEWMRKGLVNREP